MLPPLAHRLRRESCLSVILLLFSLFSAFLSCTDAHSWVEAVTLVRDNTPLGKIGYARGNVLRTEPGFSDRMTHLIPPNGRRSRHKILPGDHMCADSQKTPHQQTRQSPRLTAQAGDTLALWYQENGHVTLPQLSPGKPNNRGIVSVYGTTTPRATDSFLSIHKVWNRAETGGDKRGKLLAQAVFDDGRCYQQNGGAISKQRQKLFPPKQGVLPMGQNQWCHINVVLPKNAAAAAAAAAKGEDLYTLYWVWDWPTKTGLTKPEFYTSCIDINIISQRRGRHARSLGGQISDNTTLLLSDGEAP